MNDSSNLYQIYGRTRYEQPLKFIKEIVVNQSVAQEALEAVGNEGWVELIAIPASALVPVLGKEALG
ncbi:MAG: hypothetical protein R3293_20580 [Candidatus Promineifilaceae bacterium]|nr:hypothetical protein [Candidatus Promineifilaceae bacterium]